jgi:hypothetical protein
MSRLQVRRLKGDIGHYSPGVLTLDDTKLCITLEPGLQREPHPAIPAGTYKLALATAGHVYNWMKDSLTKHATSLDEKKTAQLFVDNGVPLLESVPGRGGVEIHIGNSEVDTLGCLLLGISQGSDGRILSSTAAYFKTYPKLLDYIKNDPDHSIQYIDFQSNS